MAVLNRMKTRDRLNKFDIIDTNCCCFFDGSKEIVEHLFFECPLSRNYLRDIKEWLEWKGFAVNFQNLIR